jgi:hypothetical protein
LRGGSGRAKTRGSGCGLTREHRTERTGESARLLSGDPSRRTPALGGRSLNPGKPSLRAG